MKTSFIRMFGGQGALVATILISGACDSVEPEAEKESAMPTGNVIPVEQKIKDNAGYSGDVDPLIRPY